MRDLDTLIARVRCDLPITEEEERYLRDYLEELEAGRARMLAGIGAGLLTALASLLFYAYIN